MRLRIRRAMHTYDDFCNLFRYLKLLLCSRNKHIVLKPSAQHCILFPEFFFHCHIKVLQKNAKNVSFEIKLKRSEWDAITLKFMLCHNIRGTCCRKKCIEWFVNDKNVSIYWLSCPKKT